MFITLHICRLHYRMTWLKGCVSEKSFGLSSEVYVPCMMKVNVSLSSTILEKKRKPSYLAGSPCRCEVSDDLLLHSLCWSSSSPSLVVTGRSSPDPVGSVVLANGLFSVHRDHIPTVRSVVLNIHHASFTLLDL